MTMTYGQLRECALLIGRVNDREFLGHEAGTLRLSRLHFDSSTKKLVARFDESDNGFGYLYFSYDPPQSRLGRAWRRLLWRVGLRPHPNYRLLHLPAERNVEMHKPADFSPLADVQCWFRPYQTVVPSDVDFTEPKPKPDGTL